MLQLLNPTGSLLGLGGGGVGAAAAAAAPAPAAPAAPAANPGQLYAGQLQTLTDMGFFDSDANLRALVSTGGNVQAAVERLLS
jgi:ubiquilin